MIIRLKYIIFVCVLGVTVWISNSVYHFFFDTTQPIVMVCGVQEGQAYAGNMECKISSDKNGQLVVLLDEKPLITNFKVHAGSDSHHFMIPTDGLANGKHCVKAILVDATFNKNKVAIERTFYIDNIPLHAAFIKQDAQYKVFQGRTLHVQFQLNKPISKAYIQALANTYDCTPETPHSSIYECFIPIACEELPNEYLLSLTVVDRVGNSINLDTKFHIVLFPFKMQYLHVDPKHIEKEKSIGIAQAEFEKKMEELTRQSVREKLWKGAFCLPLELKRITCEFGAIRTTQEKGRYAHKAIDLVNLPKSVVWATQDGIVVIKDRYDMTGNTVVIDHGLGLLSMFCHLEDFADISVGQKIAKGNPLGTMGKTGYAQGYHLHWEMRLNNIAIDPMQWTKINF